MKSSLAEDKDARVLPFVRHQNCPDLMEVQRQKKALRVFNSSTILHISEEVENARISGKQAQQYY